MQSIDAVDFRTSCKSEIFESQGTKRKTELYIAII